MVMVIAQQITTELLHNNYAKHCPLSEVY